MFEVCAANRDHEGPRTGTIQFRAESNDLLRGECMGKTGGIGRFRKNLLHSDCPRCGARVFAQCGIDEEYAIKSAECVGQLRSQLMQVEDFDIGSGEFLCKNIGGTPSHTVIGAQRVTIRDDEDAGHISKKPTRMSF